MDVVVVDDAQVNLTLMSALLGKLPDARPTCFLSPFDALAHCRHHDPDLIIIDYMMPDMDGIELIHRLRSTPTLQQTPILMVTADHEREVRYRALESGANDFLTKPVDRIEFTSRVKNMLSLRRGQVALAQHASMLQEEVRRATAEIYERERETLNKLARAAEFRDPETGAHILRMAHVAALIAQELELDADLQEGLLIAAPMHDVGKLGTPDHILLKPGRLTPEEFEIMKRHASIGHEILKDSASPYMQLAATIALTHHEKYDGSGYPRGLSGERIPLVGRIVALADVFDALTSERPYKKAWDIDRAHAFLIAGRGSHFDPACVDAMMARWDDVLDIRARYQD
ncbi:HD-GYP domain-containing protein [Methyloversatilis thermotolerans]|uniref:HD-GYP domain-containing protein n=1 Tax=Methyloversatilis thermotolerans TaxID=1346290 RepID=UPI000373F20B|nr:HD domain-containing phosphohydrolase [Methyloversatilis thermotolerans]